MCPLCSEIILLRFSQNDKLWFHRLDRDLPGHFFGHFSESLGLRRLWPANYDGHAGVASFAYFDSHRHRAEKGNTVVTRKFFAAALTKNVIAIAGVRSDEIAHVF